MWDIVWKKNNHKGKWFKIPNTSKVLHKLLTVQDSWNLLFHHCEQKEIKAALKTQFEYKFCKRFSYCASGIIGLNSIFVTSVDSSMLPKRYLTYMLIFEIFIVLKYEFENNYNTLNWLLPVCVRVSLTRAAYMLTFS